MKPSNRHIEELIKDNLVQLESILELLFSKPDGRHKFKLFSEFRSLSTNERIAEICNESGTAMFNCLRHDIDSYLVVFEHVLFYYSGENYQPQRVAMLFNKLTKENKLDLTRYYCTGYVFSTFKGKRNQKRALLCGRLIEGMSSYLILNEDFKRLEKFLIRFRYTISDRNLYTYVLMVMVSQKRDPDSTLLAAMLLNYHVNDLTKTKKLGNFGFNIDKLLLDYFRKRNKKASLSNLRILFEALLSKKGRNEPNWFWKSYYEGPPKGVLWERYRENNQLHWESSNRTNLPRHHLFGRGFPDFIDLGAAETIEKNAAINEAFLVLRNHIRDSLRLPRVNEGWVAEKALLNTIRSWFPKLKVIHQWSPAWVKPQRIDIGIPSLKIAIEYHGTQHYEPVEYFGGKVAYNLQKKRDAKKERLCRNNKVTLCVFSESDNELAIKKELLALINRRTKHSLKKTSKRL